MNGTSTQPPASEVVWQQIVFGKLVTRPGGPIVAGFEHAYTGRSAHFEPELMPACNPTSPSLGHETSWSTNPWREAGGGILVRPHVTRARAHVLAARICGRPEAGEGVAGRFFTQAHYAVAPAADWTPASLAQLAQALQAVPMNRADYELPALRTSLELLDAPLPADWFEHAAPWLESIVDGRCRVRVAASPSADEIHRFLTELSWALCALPRALAWRISIGAGLLQNGGRFALALALRPDGASGSSASGAPGRRYVGWIRNSLTVARTMRQVGGVLADVLPQLASPFSLPPEMDWQAAAAAVSVLASETEQVEHLESWLLHGTGQAPDVKVQQLTARAGAAIDRAVREARGTGRAMDAARISEVARSRGIPCVLVEEIDGPPSADLDELASLAAREARPPYDAGLVRLFLATWARLPDATRRLLVSELGMTIGQPWARWILEDRSTRGRAANEGMAAIGRDVCVRRMCAAPEFAQQVLEDLATAPEPQAAFLVTRWAETANLTALSSRPTLSALAGMLRHEPCVTDRDAQQADRALLLRLAERAGLRLDRLLAAASSAPQIELVLELLSPGASGPAIAASQLALLLEAIALDPGARRRWEELVARHELAGRPGWRLLACAEGRLYPVEQDAVERISGTAVLTLALRGYLLSRATLERVTVADLELVLPPCGGSCVLADALSRRALEVGVPGLCDRVAAWAIRCMRLAGRDIDEVEAAIRRHPGRRGLIGRVLSLGTPDVEDPYLELAVRQLSEAPDARVRDVIETVWRRA